MPRHNTESGLTAKEQAFRAEYLVDRNATRAAKAAGYSERNASRIGSQLLAKPRVKAAIAAGLDRVNEQAEVNAADVLREIQRLAMFDPADLLDVKSPDDLKRLPEDVRRAVIGWKWDKDGRFVIEMAKERALEMLCKRFGLFTEKVEVTGKNGAPLQPSVTPEIIGALAQMTPDQLRALASKPLRDE